MKAGFRQTKRLGKPSPQPEIKRRYDNEIHDIGQARRELGSSAKELMDAIAILSEEAVQNRTMLGNGGLAPTAQSTRVRVSKGQLTVTDGPFTEAKEVIGGYAQFELKSKEEAIKGAVRFMELHKKHWTGWEGETEIRQIFWREDFAKHIKKRR